MKHLLTLIIAGFLLSSIITQSSFSQDSQKIPKAKTSRDFKKGPTKLSKQEVLNKISKNTKSFKKDIRGTWLLEEDFESGNFPPTDWTVSSGSQEWAQASYSGYGSGNYSMFYSSWNCWYSDNTIYTSNFPTTQFDDKLIFDYAYAPYDDGSFSYYDNLEIFYYDDNDANWYSLIYYYGVDLAFKLPVQLIYMMFIRSRY
ncbi:MAG: hypothetical protein IPL53_03835 [Ignavibacteria bacterium]|nr:hypothetical protein [Ignavibacteria bacterium]